MEKECHLCDCALDGDGPYYPECEAEYGRRRKMRLCLLCGEGRVYGSDLWCVACVLSGNLKPRGYPGGAAGMARRALRRRAHQKTV